jgi:hypothetical protein
VGNGNTTYYTIADQTGSNWEVGMGTYTYGREFFKSRILYWHQVMLMRYVNFTAGTKDVFVDLPAEKALYLDAYQNLMLI